LKYEKVAVVGIGMMLFSAGCGTVSVAETHPQSTTTASQNLSAKAKIGTSQYWLQSVKNHILNANVVAIRGHQLVVSQSATPSHPQGFTQTLTVTAKTQLWMDGHLQPFFAKNLNKDEALSIIMKTWPHTWPTAKSPVVSTIYGPEQQVHGIVESMTPGVVTVKDIRFLPKDRIQYIGQTEQLLYNTDTNFNGANPSDFKVGDMIQAQVFGRSGKRLMATLFLFNRGKQLTKGGYQWVQVTSHK